MNVRQRLMLIKLNEKLLQNPVYSQKLGIEIIVHENSTMQQEYNILRGEENV